MSCNVKITTLEVMNKTSPRAKRLLHKCKDSLGSDRQHPGTADMVVHIWNPITATARWEVETGKVPEAPRKDDLENAAADAKSVIQSER